MTFKEWLEEIDKLLVRIMGLDHMDIEDYDWYSEWSSGMSPEESVGEWDLLVGPSSMGW